MIRTAGPGHLEDRTVSSACNPYLAFAAYLSAGLDGVRNRIDPGKANLGNNMYSLGLEQIKRSDKWKDIRKDLVYNYDIAFKSIDLIKHQKHPEEADYSYPGAMNNYPDEGDNHGADGENVLFADAHVEFVKRENYNYSLALGNDALHYGPR